MLSPFMFPFRRAAPTGDGSAEDTIQALGTDFGDPTGWVDTSKATISTLVTTGPNTQSVKLTPTDAGGFSIYSAGIKTTFTTTQTIPISDTEGWHYVYWSGGAWHVDTAFPRANFSTAGLSVFCYWNKVNRTFLFVCDERHGANMPWSVHLWLHLNQRTKYISGFGLTATPNVSTADPGGSDASSRVYLEGGSFSDEDITATIVSDATPTLPFEQDLGSGQLNSNAAMLPIYYFDGVGVLRKYAAQASRLAFKPGATYPQYNRLNANVWDLQEIGSDQRAIYWLCVTNSITEPVFLLMGQAAYASLTTAQSVTPANITWPTDMQFAEILVLNRIIFRVRSSWSSTSKTKIEAVDQVIATVATVPTVQAHSSLGALGYVQSGHTGFQRTTHIGTTDPQVSNDGVDTAGIGRTFVQGDLWLNNTSKTLYTAVSTATGAADWSALAGGPSILFSGYASAAGSGAGELVYPYDVVETAMPAYIGTVAAAGTITFATAGWYRFNFRSDSTQDGQLYLAVRKDGVIVATAQNRFTGSYYMTNSMDHTEYVAAGSIITIVLWTVGGNKWVAHTADCPGRLQIHRG